jgi:amino acid transporter
MNGEKWMDCWFYATIVSVALLASMILVSMVIIWDGGDPTENVWINWIATAILLSVVVGLCFGALSMIADEIKERRRGR